MCIVSSYAKLLQQLLGAHLQAIDKDSGSCPHVRQFNLESFGSRRLMQVGTHKDRVDTSITAMHNTPSCESVNGTTRSIP